MDDPTATCSQTLFVITYAHCPLVWGSKLQMEIAINDGGRVFSSVHSSVIPILALAKEAADCQVFDCMEKPTIHCKMFEDNEGAVEMANVLKMRPRLKHLNIKYHFLRRYVEDGMLQVHHITGEHQIANIFTKLLVKIAGW